MTLKHLEETMQVLVMNGMKIINIFWPKKPFASWVKDTTATACWKSPIGDAPELTAEQQTQNTGDENTPATHEWEYVIGMKPGQSWDLTDRLSIN